MRDDEWLNNRLNQIWTLLFSEVEKKNNVIVRFKGKWRNKFGHIKRIKNIDTEICVNGLFKNEVVPECIIDITLAHELIHYMHGFNSPHERKYKYPHQGGIVKKELLKRGFGHSLRLEKKFIKEWRTLYKELI